MQRVMKILTLDIKMKGFFKDTIISLSMLIGLLLLGIQGEILFLNYPKDIIRYINKAVLSLLPYIILVTLSISLTREFENKTDKIIFTGIFSRTEIIISKLISFVVTGLVCWTFYIVVSIIFGEISFKGAVNSGITFIIYTFGLGGFTLLISTITSNGIITGIIIYVLHFDLTLVVLGQVMASTKSLFIKGIIENSPFFIANTGFGVGRYTFEQAVVMILYGIITLIITFGIINKKNI